METHSKTAPSLPLDDIRQELLEALVEVYREGVEVDDAFALNFTEGQNLGDIRIWIDVAFSLLDRDESLLEKLSLEKTISIGRVNMTFENNLLRVYVDRRFSILSTADLSKITQAKAWSFGNQDLGALQDVVYGDLNNIIRKHFKLNTPEV